MERKPLIIGIVLIVAGLMGRHIPHVVTGISFWSIAEFFGIVLVVRDLFLRRRGILLWIKGAPLGKQVALGGALALAVLGLDLGAGVAGEIKAGKHYEVVAADLAKKDPLAAISLARHFSGEKSAPLRRRIVIRMGELGNSSPGVTGTLREAVRTDPDNGVRSAAAVALANLMTPRDVLGAVLELPRLDATTRASFVEILSRRTGQDFGPDSKRWLAWVVSDWVGERGDAAWRLALEAWQGSPDQPAIRAECLLRLEDPQGISEQALTTALRHESPRIRGAAATAIGRTHVAKWAPVLGDALKTESDSVTATAMAAAVLDLDPGGAGLTLLGAARTGTSEAGRNAALTALAARYGTGGSTDLAEVVYAVRKTLTAAADRRETLELLVKMARDSETARARLDGILTDRSESALDRGRALAGILAADGQALTDLELVELLVDPPGVDFAQQVRGELKRRTNQDGGRDAEAWRKIVKEAAAAEKEGE